ncbi:SpvB/TcaC N-terminal domain-containing protein [Pseudomonas paralactis]|uniref:SpvB/TcaC N-terminal domain-containing protein n=1 Tax=Pseudomonas paralactis TaxID=1615673 RepID=UPI0034D7A0FA
MSMQSSDFLEPAIPALPKGGGAIQGPGVSWGPVGSRGEASLDVPLPISPGRGFDPALSLGYRSSQGNGPFGLGWALSAGAISRDTRKGIPAYGEGDRFVSPQGVELIPERDAHGEIHVTACAQYNGLPLSEAHRVVRYVPIVEGRFDRIEHWTSASDTAGFWLVQGADGCVHLFGKTLLARCADPQDSRHVAQWLLQESLNPLGEQIYYHYKPEDQHAPTARDYRAQRYLARVCYGNLRHREHLALWNTDVLAENQWHFELLLDYGERHTELSQVPTYAEQQPWLSRSDPFCNYAYGFELGTQRLCRQILMFHYFPGEPSMGANPVLTRRLLLEYTDRHAAGNCLNALHNQAYDAQGTASAWPPLELAYSPFKPVLEPARYQPFDGMAGVNDGQHYQLVDLYNDGLPGILHRTDKNWYYREPLRAPRASGLNAVTYGPWQALPRIPVADTAQATRQALADLNGDGQLEWVVAQPGLSGFFTLDTQRQWSSFTPFAALPQEFFHPHGQLADLMGSGRLDLVLIGNRSVRLYAQRQSEGYGAGLQVPHEHTDEGLPTLSHTPTELVAFCDPLGSGQQHLVRIRHNEIRCWPNLGRGRFGKGFVFAALPFDYASFDAANIRLADLDGSGAVDLIYLKPEQLLIFINRTGGGLMPPVTLPWPEGVRHDATCQVSFADLQGLGCSSLILSVPHLKPRHWRFDFVRRKPYLLTATLNNMGAATQLSYRSSAQEWLDEKLHGQKQGKLAGSSLAFPIPLVKSQRQKDQVSGNRSSQYFGYREACYDAIERQFLGYGLVLENDHSPTAKTAKGVLTKRWFNTLSPSQEAFYAGDPHAPALGPSLLGRLEAGRELDTLIANPNAATQREMQRALAGGLLREELYAADDEPQSAVPYSVQQQRYLVRQVSASRNTGEPSVLVPLMLESMVCSYERQKDDPRCRHTLNLRWDPYASNVHSVVVDYARRHTADSTAAPGLPHEQQWWRDAHDPAQQAYYINESRAHFIHLDAPQRWRLQLPYQQRSNVLVLSRSALASEKIGYEHFIAEHPSNPLGQNASRQLAGLSTQHYCLAAHTTPLPPGTASFQALPAYVEVAELDEQTLSVYPDRTITATLTEQHYRRMQAFLSTNPGQDEGLTLWSIGQGYTRYGQPEAFYRPRRYQASMSHGVTQSEYDAYWLYLIKVQSADGCLTQAQYDYRLGLPLMVTDAQRTQQYAYYDAHGQLIAAGLKGEEQGKTVGDDTRQSFFRPPENGPAEALADPQTALLHTHMACFYDVFSWMGRVAPANIQAQWVHSGYLLPSGHIRGSALIRLNSLADTLPHHQTLKALIKAATRVPVHAVVLHADRWQATPAEDDRQIHIALAFSDGFGRVRQTQEQAQPGPAFHVDAAGTLSADAEPLDASSRWRISGRVEHDNRGQVTQTWRPYFVDRPGYINDAAFNASRPSERHFHDALGRLVRTLNANGDTRRQTYRAWYSVSEDENDTHPPA